MPRNRQFERRRKMYVDEYLIHKYYEAIPNWIENLPEELGRFFDSLKSDIDNWPRKSQIKYLAVLSHYHQSYDIPYTLSDIEFIINHLEATIPKWTDTFRRYVESLSEVINSYEGPLSDELERKYDRIKDCILKINPSSGKLTD